MLDILFGSKLRAKVLAWLFTHPDERFFVRRLTRLLQEDSTNVSRELVRLEKTGIITMNREGNQKYYQANRNSPVFNELHGLMLKTNGIGDIMRKALEPESNRIDSAFIFGSVARGDENLTSDIDLMVIGDISFSDVSSLLFEAEKKLGRDINLVVYPPEEFRNRARENQHFISGVLADEKIFITGNADELGRLAD